MNQHNNLRGKGVCLSNKALILHRERRYPEAIKFYLEAINSARELQRTSSDPEEQKAAGIAVADRMMNLVDVLPSLTLSSLSFSSNTLFFKFTLFVLSLSSFCLSVCVSSLTFSFLFL
jgi:hypothetical protein